MSLSNITATSSNGTQVVSVTNVAPAGGVSSCTDECLVLTINNALGTNDRLNAKIEISKSVVKILDVDYAIGYGGSTSIRSQANITDSYIHWAIGTSRKNIRLTSLVNSTIRCTGGVGALGFLLTQAGNQAVLDNAVVDGIYVHQPEGLPLTFKNVTYKNCGLNFCNWDIGDITLTGVVFGSGTATGTSYMGADGQTYTTYDVWVGSGNANNKLRMLDSTLNMSKIAINLTSSAGAEIVFKSYSRTEKYVVGAVALEGANVRFTPTASSGSSSQVAFDRVTNSSGYLANGGAEEKSVSLLVQNSVDSGTARSTGLVDPSSTRNYTLKNITWSRSVRRADILGDVDDVTPIAKVGSTSDAAMADFPKDTQFTGTVAQAAAITGVSFAVANGLVAISASVDRTGQEIYNAWKHWTSQFEQFGISQSLISITNGELLITGSMATTAVITAGGNVSKIKATVQLYASGSGKYSLPFEDASGVRVTIKAPSPTLQFNIAARYGSATFTNLGFFTATGEITFTVPKGKPLEVAIWAFGYSTYVTTVDTTEGGSIFTVPLAINTAVDTTLNVDSYLSKMALSLDESGATPKLVLTVNEPLTVAGIELGKAITHKLAGLQVALNAALTFGDVTPLDIEPTEILNNLPAFSLVVGAAVPATGRVYFDFFINTAPAIAIDPFYVLNPIRADGNQVQILRVKPDIDPTQMAAGVIAGGVATSAQVMARPTLEQIEAAGGKLDTAMKAAKSAKFNTTG